MGSGGREAGADERSLYFRPAHTHIHKPGEGGGFLVIVHCSEARARMVTMLLELLPLLQYQLWPPDAEIGPIVNSVCLWT